MFVEARVNSPKEELKIIENLYIIDINMGNVAKIIWKIPYRMVDPETNPTDFCCSRPGFPPLLARARLSFFEQSSLLPGPSDVSYKKCRKKRVGGEKKAGETL